MDAGRPGKRLALDAGVTPPTASAHLRKLMAANMLIWQGQGRSKYFSLAGSSVAQAVEILSGIGAVYPLPAAACELRFARCCYDHLAGRLGVCITERLMRPANGVLAKLGIDPGALEGSRRLLFRCCTDWTERKPHLAGALGAVLLRHYLEQSWLLRVEESRRLVVTPRGRDTFVRVLGVDDSLFA